MNVLYKLDALLENGPEKEHYGQVDAFIASLDKDRAQAPEYVAGLQQKLLAKSPEDCMQYHVLKAPYGYKGDFRAIDMIYSRHMSTDACGRRWDAYFHQHAAPQAVRNRKEYFKTWVKSELRHGPLQLLNLASGPGRDLAELYDGLDRGLLRSTCLDADARAIRYSIEVCKAHSQSIDFKVGNALKYSPDRGYDLIWSAGLFDYFSDRVFVLLLRKMGRWLKPGGQLAIGNFSLQNPSRAYMELFGNWYLQHRSKEQLQALALQAGFGPDKAWVGEEPLGINLFLHIRY